MLKIFPAYDALPEVCELFSEYTQMLIQGDPAFSQYLEVQNYENELKDLTLKYGMPDGRLYLAYVDDKPAGCIGLKKIDAQNCEMKRLYVRPQFRGKQIGNQLIQQIIQDAKKIGYSHMLLDTLPFLQSALHLYQTYGFYEIPCYNNSPMDTSTYMRLDLPAEKTIFYPTDFLKNEEITLQLEKTLEADIEKDWLPAYCFSICDKSGHKMGVCDLRIGHNRNTYYSGNIGYQIQEEYRGHHYAGKVCQLLLELAKKHHMRELIITCSPDNYASRKTCEYAGARLIEIVPLPKDHPTRLQYGATEKCRYQILLNT